MSDTRANQSLILLLGNYRPSLVLARTFSRRGFEVAVGSHGCERLCQYSNAVSSIWDHSQLTGDPTRFHEELSWYAEQNPQLVAIIPVAEEYVRLFAEHESLFADIPTIVTMDADLVRQCLDKPFMLDLAQSVGVNSAPFAYSRGLAETLRAVDQRVSYPLVLRPKNSTERLGGLKAVCVDEEEELIANFKSLGIEGQELLLQSKFDGKRHNVYFAAEAGQAHRLLHAVIDRTDKLDGTGLAVEGRTLSVDHDCVEQTRTLLTALNYSGIGCAQFLVDEKSGKTSFLEINPRIAGNHALPEHARLDLGWFNFDRIVNRHIDPCRVEPSAGIRFSWLGGDLMGAKVAFLRGEIRISALIKWCAKAIWSAIRADTHIVFSFRDPYPALRSLWNVFPRIARWRRPEIAPGENTIYSRKERSYS